VLKNREGRYKPNDPKIAGLKRIDKINFLGQIFLSDKPSNTDMILVKKGDLVISGINVEKGALAVYEGEEDILATIHYSSYIFDTTKIDIDFLKIFLRSPDFVQLLKEQVPGGIKTEIKPKHILPLEVYFPETTEEQKIIAAHFFEKEVKLNQLQKQLSHQLTLLDQLNQAILQEAVQGKLVPQVPSRKLSGEPASELLKRIKEERQKSLPAGAKRRQEKPLPPIKPEEIPFEIPKNWMWCRLGEICDRIHYGFNASAKPNNTGVRLLRITDIQENAVDWNTVPGCDYTENDLENYLLNENDIVIARTGGTIGKTFLVKNIPLKALFASYLIRAIPSNTVFPEYLKFFMESPVYWKQLYDSAGGAAQPNVNGTSLSNLVVPLPPLSEQKRIVAEIERQLAKTKQLKEHIIANQQATEQLLKALLHQAFEVKENEENLAKA
jgi:type I restriction enzyme S subunit